MSFEDALVAIGALALVAIVIRGFWRAGRIRARDGSHDYEASMPFDPSPPTPPSAH